MDLKVRRADNRISKKKKSITHNVFLQIANFTAKLSIASITNAPEIFHAIVFMPCNDQNYHSV